MYEDERAHYRQLLRNLRSRVTDEVRATAGQVVERLAPPDELSHVPTHAADRDSEDLDCAIALQANREQMLEAIDGALARVSDGSYGCCVDCRGEIGKTRLEVLPFASRCVKCEGKQQEE